MNTEIERLKSLRQAAESRLAKAKREIGKLTADRGERLLAGDEGAAIMVFDAAINEQNALARIEADRMAVIDAKLMQLPTLPSDPDAAAARLAELCAQRDVLLNAQEQARRNPMRTGAAISDDALRRIKSEIETIERSLRALGRLAA